MQNLLRLDKVVSALISNTPSQKGEHPASHLENLSFLAFAFTQIEIVEFSIARDIVPRVKEDMAKLAVWNGYEILNLLSAN